MQINYYIGGLEIEPPINQAEFGIELNFDKNDNSNQAVSLTEFEFGVGDQTLPNDASALINLHRTNGLNTGVGIFEGLPFTIELTKDGNTEILFDGYLNTSTALWDCDKVIVQATEKGNIDFLNETADSVTFAYLYEKTPLRDDFNFISVPYVLSSVPNNQEAFLALVSLIFILDTLQREISNIIGIISRLVNVFEWTAVISLIIKIIYVVGLIALLVELMQRLVNLLIQPIKYHEVMTAKSLCEIGASHFDMTFESSILDEDIFRDKLVLMPKKYAQDVNVTDYGVTGPDEIIGNITPLKADSRGYYKGTFGQLLRDLKEVFNAKIIIEGTIIRLEREDYNNSSQNYIIPPVDQTQYTLNASDLKSNYTVEFQTDINDKHTILNYDGVITQAISRPDRIVNNDMVLMTGLESRNIPFARATIKTGLTSVEKIVLAIAKPIDAIVIVIQDTISPLADTVEKAIKKIKSKLDDDDDVDVDDINAEDAAPDIPYEPLADRVETRLGMLLMENDIVDVPKIFLIDESTKPIDTNISANNVIAINSEYLYNNYHFIRNFAITEERPEGNQYKIYNAIDVPFCYSDYLLLKDSNYLQDSEGRGGELISCRWNVEKEVADIEYKINEAYTNNIEVELITPNGK